MKKVFFRICACKKMWHISKVHVHSVCRKLNSTDSGSVDNMSVEPTAPALEHLQNPVYGSPPDYKEVVGEGKSYNQWRKVFSGMIIKAANLTYGEQLGEGLCVCGGTWVWVKINFTIHHAHVIILSINFFSFNIQEHLERFWKAPSVWPLPPSIEWVAPLEDLWQ